MSYFGYPSDLLEHLASECEATAPIHQASVRDAMLHLARALHELSPLYEAICRYGMDDHAEDTDVAAAMKLISQHHKED